METTASPGIESGNFLIKLVNGHHNVAVEDFSGINIPGKGVKRNEREKPTLLEE